jgi:prolyl-tRNA editing enzyme YbaK/EbsC (Cys-tRNA(Pro) deacylase)
MALEHPNVVTVAAALRRLGADSAADGIRVLPDAATTAASAAEQLGCEVGAIANSLIFDADGEPVLVMTSGAHRVDTVLVATLLGVGSLDRASAEFVREHTGQPIGGGAPVGHPAPIGTIVDVALMAYDTVWSAAGHPHTVFPLTFDELVRITEGTPAEVGP